MQKEMSGINRNSWNKDRYQAWLNKFGSIEQEAQRIISDPRKRLKILADYLGDIREKRVINLLGSNGTKAISVALMGAKEVMVVDIAEENARFGYDLAGACNVKIDYIVTDIMDLAPEELGEFDIVFFEMGVLHYIYDINKLFEIAYRLLSKGGRFVLREYHPVIWKLLKPENGRYVASGNYFDQSVIGEEMKVRRWNLGEVVTAIINAGFTIKALHEESGQIKQWVFKDMPEGTEDKVPGIYAVIASK
ncbi:class I SAM-dependent methyltransferase [Paenibacillus sp. LHD-38]|uniref:class I SAM-dependent methyltransferase n=1 Tax=Paenibacillus sp. LHD-38 TaxID=3072143 RepID=UPI00280DB31F|nr:class I SAM-dependent methyltransferase [Paenibacillus sp. LHD-38]MDQ8737008.1 class I SAM-dependent methyltransferase [Paenibacillus sp. LHD-38]